MGPSVKCDCDGPPSVKMRLRWTERSILPSDQKDNRTLDVPTVRFIHMATTAGKHTDSSPLPYHNPERYR